MRFLSVIMLMGIAGEAFADPQSVTVQGVVAVDALLPSTGGPDDFQNSPQTCVTTQVTDKEGKVLASGAKCQLTPPPSK